MPLQLIFAADALSVRDQVTSTPTTVRHASHTSGHAAADGDDDKVRAPFSGKEGASDSFTPIRAYRQRGERLALTRRTSVPLPGANLPVPYVRKLVDPLLPAGKW